MIAGLVEFALVKRVFVCILGLALLCGGLYAFHILDVVAYPDPSPPMVEVITQYPGWSAEEIERQITIPIETALLGMPGLRDIRSLSIFGLSDIKFYFDFGTEYFRDRQEVLKRLAMLSFPTDVQPALSPWWAIAEIYRYELVGDSASLTDLKTLQDWVLQREFKRVPGVIDVTAFGGTTKQYHVDLNPGALISYGVSLSQVMTALGNSNANVGGNYLTVGAQNFNVRGLGLINSLEDIENVMVAEKSGTPVFVRNLGKVSVGYRVRLGKVGIDDRDDVVEGVVLLQRGYKALSVLERVQQKVQDLNTWKLPKGVQVKTFYDRIVLIHTTIETVTDIVISGIALVFVVLFVFLGHFRTAVIVALTVPMALLFTFCMMVLVGESANLISLGAIDFGIIVDATLIMVESIFYHLAHGKKTHGLTIHQHIVRAARQVGQPIFYSTAIIVVAFIPLFTMTGVPGKIFSPMSITYGFALVGALLMAFTLAPVMCSFLLKGPISEDDTAIVRGVRRFYNRILEWALDHRTVVVGACVGLLALTFGVHRMIGGEFMPALEEGNLWVRATMPVDISFDQAAKLTSEIRRLFRDSPEVTTIVSQLGRPDDGTDPTSFFNAEFLANLKPEKEWRPRLSKAALIEEIEGRLKEIPGIIFNFSQVIQDNVEEAMSGVKGENSIKLFGTDLKTMEVKASEIERVMQQIKGVKDLGILRLVGQPNLLIQVDREASARYGLRVADVNAVVQAAVGGQAVTQVYEGERLFDLVVRFLPEFRQDVDAIGNILVSTPDGARIPLKQVASITTQTGAFIIYRENNERYIPIKFSVRDRDLQGTVEEAQARLAKEVSLPNRYRMEWAGQYDQLRAEQKRMAMVVPISLVIIMFLLYSAFNSIKNALLVLSTVPFALVGGAVSLAVTHTNFSISAAVGVISTLGVAILGGVLLISRIEEFRLTGLTLREAVRRGTDVQMRPILMATLGAAIGLLPAALATGIGSQAQKPLALVVVGGMLTAAVLILVVLPVLYEIVHHRSANNNGGGERG